MTAIGEAPSDLPIETVKITTARGNQISGWFIPAKPAKGAVLLMHGVRSNRLQMLERARFLYGAGYSSLLFDFQAHGESAGEHITFGYLEQQDAWAAFQYLKQRQPQQKIAVLGVSLGGASALLSEIPQQANALILEAVYSDLETAIANRLEIRLGAFSRHLVPLLSWQIKPRLGFNANNLAPLQHIAKIKAPVLIIAGGKDQHTKLAESEAFYELAPEPKQLWVLPEAKHVDFQEYTPQAYQQRLLSFLDEYLSSN
ncbi:MAG TPA: alpha/beta hydrolase [Thiolinea sp.]|nr:alpha/beta hydrolase [Thiolinea sp.]